MKPFSSLVAAVILAAVFGCTPAAPAPSATATPTAPSAVPAVSPTAPRAAAESPPSRLQCRAMPFDHDKGGPVIPIPADAVRIFTFEGGPCRPALAGDHIAVDYGASGVLFDRKTGQVDQRLTVADGWPALRPGGFPPPYDDQQPRLFDPGVVAIFRHGNLPEPAFNVAARIEYLGRTWMALQPHDLIQEQHRPEPGATLTSILRKANEKACLEAVLKDQSGLSWYTMDEGLAGNLVTHLADNGGLWAACMDIYDPAKKEWGPGGLCRYDPEKDRWELVGKVDGHLVRWVSLLVANGDDLWVGFREGTGLVDDRPGGDYRPKVTQLVLARRDWKNEWHTFTREAVANLGPKEGPQEALRRLYRVGNKVYIYSEREPRGPAFWGDRKDGIISVVDLGDGSWRVFDAEKDFGARTVCDMVAEEGEIMAATDRGPQRVAKVSEILAVTDRGVHRWMKDGWTFLDPQSTLLNPSVDVMAVVGDELWMGYTRQGFGVWGRQGLSRYNERTGQWRHVPEEEFGSSASVRQIIPGPGGEAWVLLGVPPEPLTTDFVVSSGPDEEVAPPKVPFVMGLARYADGKWEFPAKLEGIPASEEMSYQSPKGKETYTDPRPIGGIAAVGDHLFVYNSKGVYMGPKPWKLVVERDASISAWFAAIGPAPDGKSLEIFREVLDNPAGGHLYAERAEYNPAGGKVEFKIIAGDPAARERFDKLRYGPYWRSYNSSYAAAEPPGREDEWLPEGWLQIPAPVPGRWAVGGLRTSEMHDSISRRIFETPTAVWIISPGELIRLDREKLKACLGAPPAAPAATGS